MINRSYDFMKWAIGMRSISVDACEFAIFNDNVIDKILLFCGKELILKSKNVFLKSELYEFVGYTLNSSKTFS